MKSDLVYTGALTNQNQQKVLHDLLQYVLIKPPKPEHWDEETWENAWQIGLISIVSLTKNQAFEAMKDYPDELQETLSSILEHIDPQNIATYKFYEPLLQWPTFGEVYDYLCWLISPTTVPSPLPAVITASRVAPLNHDKQMANTGLNHVQQKYLQFMIDRFNAVGSEFFVGDEHRFDYQNIEELYYLLPMTSFDTLKTQEQDEISDCFVQVMTLVLGFELFEKSHRPNFKSMSKTIQSRLNELQLQVKAFENGLCSGKIDDLGFLRSLCERHLVHIFTNKSIESIDPESLSAALSCLAVESWVSFLNEVHILDQLPRLFKSNTCLGIFKHIAKESWPSLLGLPGFEKALIENIAFDKRFEQNIGSFDESRRWALLTLPPVLKALEKPLSTHANYATLLKYIPNDYYSEFIFHPFFVSLYENLLNHEQLFVHLIKVFSKHLYRTYGVAFDFLKINAFSSYLAKFLKKGGLIEILDILEGQFVGDFIGLPLVYENIDHAFKNTHQLQIVLGKIPVELRLQFISRPAIAPLINELLTSLLRALGLFSYFRGSDWEKIYPLKLFSHISEKGMIVLKTILRKASHETIDLGVIFKNYAQYKNIPVYIDYDDFENSYVLAWALAQIPILDWPVLINISGDEEKLLPSLPAFIHLMPEEKIIHLLTCDWMKKHFIEFKGWENWPLIVKHASADFRWTLFAENKSNLQRFKELHDPNPRVVHQGALIYDLLPMNAGTSSEHRTVLKMYKEVCAEQPQRSSAQYDRTCFFQPATEEKIFFDHLQALVTSEEALMDASERRLYRY